ncbi:MAG TPA: hypothetical protein VD886_26530 [Herpetosiphonaceae bacterium]|nr:hypothetical protein [Herpetosiphonaceae bacterium]
MPAPRTIQRWSVPWRPSDLPLGSQLIEVIRHAGHTGALTATSGILARIKHAIDIQIQVVKPGC